MRSISPQKQISIQKVLSPSLLPSPAPIPSSSPLSLLCSPLLVTDQKPTTQTKGPPPLVICGPAGVGKGTLINLLISKYPSLFGFSVSHTTRAPRPGEEHGVHYYFTSIDEMKSAIANHQFIEYAQVHTNFYGTSYEAVNQIRKEGRICVLDIDIQGVQSVKRNSSMECQFIFIAPPTMEDLEKRLRGRGTETNDKILIRLENAKTEMEYGYQEGNFDAIFVNDEVEGTFERIVKYLEEKYGEYGFQR
jgi:guanylate kinase